MARDVGFWWTSTGWYVRPNTARDVMNVLGAIGVYNSSQSFGWRGMSSADYRLTSSLQRSLGHDVTERAVRNAEMQLLAAARSWGLGLGPNGYVDDLQLLADLQHYGIATRLLDFTSNPMTALWFACQTPKTPGVAKSGVLLALNITGMKQIHTVSAGAGTYAVAADPIGARLRQALGESAPFIVRSLVPNDRLRAQEGFFVSGAVPPVSGTESVSLTGIKSRILRVDPFEAIDVQWKHTDPDKLSSSLSSDRSPGHPSAMPFVAVIIKAQLKEKLLRYLENTYNRSARVLFPDYAGFLEFRPEPEARTTVAD